MPASILCDWVKGHATDEKKNKERKKRKSKKHDRKKKALTWLEETENGRKPANKKYVSSAAPTWVYM